MILPTKHISAKHSILGAGAAIIRQLDSGRTVSALWERVMALGEIGVYWRFILALDLLFAIGAVDLVDGLIVRREP